MNLNDVTCLIPLYRSKRMLPWVFANIDSHIAEGASVLCSDEHELDEAAGLIEGRYKRNPQVTVLRSNKGGDWISNCNKMIAACQTPYFRIVPHDDTVEGESTRKLVKMLRTNPSVILSHGWVRAESEDGTRLPERDEPFFPLRPIDDPAAFSAGLFWQGLYSGAFKAVVRRNVFNGEPLYIRPTPTLKHSERAWLFGYSLLGDFAFSEEAAMIKRYWQGSLTHGWKNEAADIIAVAEVMASFVDDFVICETERRTLRVNLFLNATRRANWIDGLVANRLPFEPPISLTGESIAGRAQSSG